MKPNDYITDNRAFVESLMENALGRKAEQLRRNWRGAIDLMPSGSLPKMRAAYLFAQHCKEEADLYPFLCFWLACHDIGGQKLNYYYEAIMYCKDANMMQRLKMNRVIVALQQKKEQGKGIERMVEKRIDGIERLRPFYAEDAGCLHDAEIRRMTYDREQGTLDLEVYVPSRPASRSSCTIPFHFSGLFRIETDIEADNDTVWESRIYDSWGHVCVEFESARVRILSRQLSIGKIS